MMLFESLLNRGPLPVLGQVLNFTEARHEVLANNISNFDTVGHKAQDLPVEEFFGALRQAVDRRNRCGAGQPLEMPSTRHLQWDRTGRLKPRPVQVQGNNILFHDRNNRFVEKQMSEMSQNALMHNLTVEMLRQQYTLLQLAIRGRL